MLRILARGLFAGSFLAQIEEPTTTEELDEAPGVGCLHLRVFEQFAAAPCQGYAPLLDHVGSVRQFKGGEGVCWTLMTVAPPPGCP